MVLSEEYQTYAAISGDEAFIALENNDIDLILLDINLSEKEDSSGFNLIKQLKSDDITRNIPVIFLTGELNDEFEIKGLALGAVDFIKKPFNSEIVKLRVKIHLQLAESIANFKFLSLTDELTSLPNKRCFNETLKLEWNRSQRSEGCISTLMLDIDHFKKYNDTYGHFQGDKALQTVAKVIKSQLHRPGDYASRWGGEEFCVLLPQVDSEGAVNVAENIRKAIEDTIITDDNNNETKVTVSIGAYTYKFLSEFGPSCNIDTFVENADMALYEAKNNGRNQVKAKMSSGEL